MGESDETVDHYVWEGFYLRDSWDESPADELLAASKERAMELIAESADVPNAGWEENERSDNSCYQLHRTTHHIVTVRKVPVYA